MIKRLGLLVHPDEFTDDLPEIFRQAGFNTLGIHPVGGVRAHETLVEAEGLLASPAYRKRIADAAARGITVGVQAHALRRLMPQSLFAEHPEWFRMNEAGERVTDANLCVSNPEAMEYLTARAEMLGRLIPTDGPLYYYWPDDCDRCGCRCPECVRLSPSDQQLRIANAILRGLKRVRSDAKLSFLAYCDTLTPPAVTEPEEGIFAEFAPIRRNHHAPLFGDDPKNKNEVRGVRDLLSFFGTKDAAVLDYWMDNSLFSGWVKPPKPFALDEAVLAADAEAYDRLGFESIFAFGCFLGPDYRALYGMPPFVRCGEILRGTIG